MSSQLILALALACGFLLGFLPGKEAMTVQAAGAGAATVPEGDAEEELGTPPEVRWSELLGDAPRHSDQGARMSFTEGQEI